jgi:hypothetical protein
MAGLPKPKSYQEKYELADKTQNLNDLEGRSAKLKKDIANLTPELVRQRGAVRLNVLQTTPRNTKTTFAPDLDET